MSLFFLLGRVIKFLHGNNSTAEASSSNPPFVYSSFLFFSFALLYFFIDMKTTGCYPFYLHLTSTEPNEVMSKTASKLSTTRSTPTRSNEYPLATSPLTPLCPTHRTYLLSNKVSKFQILSSVTPGRETVQIGISNREKYASLVPALHGGNDSAQSIWKILGKLQTKKKGSELGMRETGV